MATSAPCIAPSALIHMIEVAAGAGDAAAVKLLQSVQGNTTALSLTRGRGWSKAMLQREAVRMAFMNTAAAAAPGVEAQGEEACKDG